VVVLEERVVSSPDRFAYVFMDKFDEVKNREKWWRVVRVERPGNPGNLGGQRREHDAKIRADRPTAV
jgi:hypothetical protein